MKYDKYSKVTNLRNTIAVCAIYEPHPFRNSVISEAVGFDVDTGFDEDKWIWVYYDWIGNPIGLGEQKPNGTGVKKFTAKNLGFANNDENGVRLAEYLNQKLDIV